LACLKPGSLIAILFDFEIGFGVQPFVLLGGIMKRFLFGFIAATMLLAGNICRADVVKYDSVDGPVNYLGNYLLGAGGSLTQLNQSASAGPNWFQKTSGVGSFFNIGTTAAAPFTNSEYVSLGNGASASAGICQFFFEYAANTADGTLQAAVNVYTFDGSGANQAPIASFLLNLPTPGGTAGTFLYGITVTLPQAQHFTVPTQSFEYGMRMTGGTGNFGPRIQTNFPGQTFGQLDTHLGGVGTSLNAFQSFTPPGQNGGAFSGNFWFGATGPWAGAVFSMAIPEPATGAAFLLIGIAGVFARRRR
jgi:hypothetical protein